MIRVLVIRKLSDPCFSNSAIRQSGDPVIRVLVHAMTLLVCLPSRTLKMVAYKPKQIAAEY